MKIKLLCHTGGKSYGDVVSPKEIGISDEYAINLIADGLAVKVEEAVEAETTVTEEPKSKKKK